jgi:hypothetical protein
MASKAGRRGPGTQPRRPVGPDPRGSRPGFLRARRKERRRRSSKPRSARRREGESAAAVCRLGQASDHGSAAKAHERVESVLLIVGPSSLALLLAVSIRVASCTSSPSRIHTVPEPVRAPPPERGGRRRSKRTRHQTSNWGTRCVLLCSGPRLRLGCVLRHSLQRAAIRVLLRVRRPSVPACR